MFKQCSVRYFVVIHKLQTELDVFEAKGVTNFGTWCKWARSRDSSGLGL